MIMIMSVSVQLVACRASKSMWSDSGQWSDACLQVFSPVSKEVTTTEKWVRVGGRFEPAHDDDAIFVIEVALTVGKSKGIILFHDRYCTCYWCYLSFSLFGAKVWGKKLRRN